MAYGGNCLYLSETSYTGLISLDTEDPTSVYISSDVNPTNGRDLVGYHEVYHAELDLNTGLENVVWKPIISNSKQRNIHPLVVSGEGRKVLLWLRKPKRTFKDYESDIVGIILK